MQVPPDVSGSNQQQPRGKGPRRESHYGVRIPRQKQKDRSDGAWLLHSDGTGTHKVRCKTDTRRPWGETRTHLFSSLGCGVWPLL